MTELHTTAISYTVNGRDSTPQSFYTVACNPQRHVVVEACAGAGKTWMLVARIGRALLADAPAHSILAITFTNKAAAEMRGRVADLLALWATLNNDLLAQELLARGVPQTAINDALLNKARGLQAEVLAGRGLAIRTFHGWFASLLRMAPLSLMKSLGLPSPYELLLDDAQAVALVWPQFYKAVYADVQLRTDFALALAANGRSNVHDALAFALSKRVEISLASDATLLNGVASVAQTVAAFAHCRHIEQALNEMPGMASALREAAVSMTGSGNTAALKAGTALGCALDTFDMQAVCAVLLTATGAPKQRGLKALDPALVVTAQAWASDWQQAMHQADCIAHQQRMARLSLCLLRCFTHLKRQRGWVDMNDIELAATKLLADSELSAWVQQRLDAGVSQLLIDEFQDTNPMQWRALLSWLEGYVGAGGGDVPRVFIVGDPKQSIYRFRRAEPRVFKAATAFVSEALGGDVLACDHTRRNALSVVQALNAVMLSSGCVANQTSESPDFRAHSTANTQHGRVLALPLLESDSQPEHTSLAASDVWRDSLLTPKVIIEDKLAALEAQQAARWVAQQVSAGVLPQDVMVIARTNARLGLMQSSLSALGIACAQPEKTTLIDSPAVADVVALLDALISPANDLALARALRSPLFGGTDAQLLWLSQQRTPHTVLLAQTAPQLKTPPPLSWRAALVQVCTQTDTEPVYQRWASDLALMTKWLHTLPLVQVLTRLYAHCDVLTAYAGAVPSAMVGATHAQLMALLDESLALNQGRFVTPYQFVRAVKSASTKRAWPTPANAVRLLTVHGSKGLEAQYVVLLDTHAPAKKAQSMSMLVDWPSDSPTPARVVFVAKEKSPPLCAKDLLATDQAARLVEENNALYVAMTRAESHLVLSGHSRSGNKDDSWWTRLMQTDLLVMLAAKPVTHVEGTETTETIDSSGQAANVLAHTVTIKHVPKWQGVPVFAEPSAVTLTGKRDQTLALSARVGQAMHQLLEWLPVTVERSQPEWSGVQLEQVRVNWSLSASERDVAYAGACAIVQGQGAWAWQSGVVDFAGSEVDIMVQGALMRLDRLVLRRDTGEWWVLDFKSNLAPQHDASLLKQLHTYRAAVSSIYPDRVVRAAFLTPAGVLIEPDNSH